MKYKPSKFETWYLVVATGQDGIAHELWRGVKSSMSMAGIYIDHLMQAIDGSFGAYTYEIRPVWVDPSCPTAGEVVSS